MVKKEEETEKKKSIPEREEEVLAFWREHRIFERSLEQNEDNETFVFYDGPPFATGLAHYGHLLAGTLKDAIPRYQSMKGKYVRRQWGWDCHGLPIENLIEGELGLEHKKDIEKYGIEKFNARAKESVLRYDKEWKSIVSRMGRFVDMEHSYKTMDAGYSESIFWAFKTLYDKGLIYEGHKSMHICPRCETTLANSEVTLNYKDIKDISITVKFALLDEPDTYVLAWTTTPWTLPGNVALAVGEDIEYVKVKIGKDTYIIAKDRLESIAEEHEVIGKLTGKDLVGKHYAPVFDYYAKSDIEKKENGWQIYPADFVTTESGTGVVHIAPAFGEDDMELGKKYKLPFVQHVSMDGMFRPEVTDFAGKYVKPKSNHQEADIEIIKHLAHAGLLFSKEKIEHSYPHCWRCDTPLLNYAASSWFVQVTKLKKRMLKENSTIRWVPNMIKDGRFGKWLEGARDWAISRSRFWGAPLPVWKCEEACEKVDVLGSVEDIRGKTGVSGNSYFVMRHGQAQSNTSGIVSSHVENKHHLTEEGKNQAKKTAEKLKKDGGVDLIIASSFIRTKETAGIVAETIGLGKEHIIFDERLWEIDTGDFNNGPINNYRDYFSSTLEKFNKPSPNGETLTDLKRRVAELLYECEEKYKDKRILFVTHEYPCWLLEMVAEGRTKEESSKIKDEAPEDYFSTAELRALPFAPIPHNRDFELDLHRPFIDEVKYPCTCGGDMVRVEDVFDCWFESGSMPYAQFHYPFENKELFKKNFPADFIAEGLDQTRGWFYNMLVLSVGLFDKTAFKNVIVNGLILAEDGQKMSKKLKNYPDPVDLINKYGADALRYYMLSSPVVRGEDLNFAQSGVEEVYKKMILRLDNVYNFYAMYESEMDGEVYKGSENVLDQWIVARLFTLHSEVSEAMDGYELDRAVRPLNLFIDDLSTWYLRRSRDRFKGEDEADRKIALATTRFILIEFAKILAPFMPFFADDLYRKVRHNEDKESVHLTRWPQASDYSKMVILSALQSMQTTRDIVEAALSARAAAGIKVRQPLAELRYYIKADIHGLSKEYQVLIADEVNIRSVVESKEKLEKGEGLEIVEATTVTVALDTQLTEQLKREGRVRELTRHVQELRKRAGLSPDDRIVLLVETDKEGEVLIESAKADIMKNANVDEVRLSSSLTGREFAIDDIPFTLDHSLGA